MGYVDLFLDKYKKLERIIRERYDLSRDESPIIYLSGQKPFYYYKEKLDAAREIRNLLSHEYLKDGKDYFIDINANLLQLLDEVSNELLHPVTCYQIAVKKVKTAAMDDYVLPIMRMMKEKGFAHIPIVQDERIIGVFSESSVFACIMQDKIMEINESTIFLELSEYLNLDNRINEKYAFVARNEPISTAEDIFEQATLTKAKVKMLFVTQNGTKYESLLGIITPLDLLARNNHKITK